MANPGRAVSQGARGAKAAGLLRRDDITGDDLEKAIERIRGYTTPYRKLLVRSEQGERLLQMVEGLTSDLERKSVEPIAVMHGIPRRGLQRFVGEPGWRWDPLRDLQIKEVTAQIGIAEGALVVDGSAVPKKGEETVGVARQWCGRLGKVDNCVVGVHAVYVGRDELSTLIGSELFLPEAWVQDAQRREASYVPKEVKYRSHATMGADLIEQLAAKGLSYEWVMGDDEFGRSQEFRDRARELGKSYIVDVPENTVVRRVNKHGRVCEKSWSVRKLARSRRDADWQRFYVRDGEKGPVEKRALMLPVATWRKGEGDKRRRIVHETLVVIEELDGSAIGYCLAHGPAGTSLATFVRRAGQRHRVEEVFEEAKGEVGLDHYEVRAWHGWHHHMTLVQLSHWFLVRERRRLGKKSARYHHQPDPDGDCSAACSAANACGPGEASQLSTPSQRGRARRSLPCAWSMPTQPQTI